MKELLEPVYVTSETMEHWYGKDFDIDQCVISNDAIELIELEKYDLYAEEE